MTENQSWNEERLAQLALGYFPGFGSRTLRKLSQAFSSPTKIFLASPGALEQAGVHSKMAEKFADWRKNFIPSKALKELQAEKIDVLFPDDPLFPRLLRESHDPPKILFIRGILKDVPLVSIVGTRRITSYGRRAAQMIIPDLIRAGLGVVSGLALGIDGCAHEIALAAQGYTIAVLGTGIDEASLYPREHLNLAHNILQSGGAIISELPPRSGGRKEHFPLRNRIIASLSEATLVIEAAPVSGSLITAKLALEENREVLAVPGPIWNETSKGTNQLIKLGAKPCTEAADVLEALTLDRPDLAVRARAVLPIDPEEERILSLLTDPRHTDEIGRELGLDPGSLSARLAVLELKGLIRPIGGQMWTR